MFESGKRIGMKMATLRYLALTLMLVQGSVLTAPMQSYAQEGGNCVCTLPPAPLGETVGLVSESVGDVMVSQPAGYVPSNGQEGLSVGSRVLVGPTPPSSATAVFGTACSVTVGLGQTLKVDETQGGICVSLEQKPVVRATDNDLSKAVLGALAVGGIVGGALLIGSGSDEPMSR